MPRSSAKPVVLPLPVAEYVRMSDEQQQYSITNQQAAMREYADSHGFVIVKTYADPNRSRVVATHRTALHDLLRDVVGGDAKYKAILVYDVSRWGRYPNCDEAAYYEYLCASAGIPLHYCAEPFINDGTAMSSLIKALKRSMAAEYSRELSDKVHRGKTRIVELGYWVGGQAGFGYRRMMVSADGKPKQIMQAGEYKNITTDRVILVHGPHREVQSVRLMFSMAAQGLSSVDIARELNKRGVPRYGKLWFATNVHKILTNPKYAGWLIWNRGSERLQKKRIHNPREKWVMVPNAFVPIVDQETYDRAQAHRPKRADQWWSDRDILRRIRRILKTKGRLSETLMRQARGMPSTMTIHKHFGKYRELYEKIGYPLAPQYIHNTRQAERSLQLRQEIVSTLEKLFPGNVKVTRLPKRARSLLLIDDTFMVSILLCRTKWKRGAWNWVVEPNPVERSYITLVCTMNDRHDRVLNYFLLSSMDWFRRRSMDDSYLRSAVHLDKVTDFYAKVLELWAKKRKLAA
jgi:DNA invertase Pin-like site-specific DNA recombinase